MEERGRKEARKILEGLGYTVEEIGKVTTAFPYDMIAEKGTEHFLIDVKYVEEEATEALRERKSTSGFPAPWICRAYQALTDKKTVSEGWKARVLVIAKRGDRVSYLFLEPRFEEPWFKCGFKESLDYTLPKIMG